MSYYIAPHTDDPTADIVVYRVVERLGDFKPEDGKVPSLQEQERKAQLQDPFVRGSQRQAQEERQYRSVISRLLC